MNVYYEDVSYYKDLDAGIYEKKKKNGRLVGYIVLSNSLGSFIILSENTYFDVGTFDIKPIT